MRKIHLTECKRKTKFDTVDIRLVVYKLYVSNKSY